jgi:DegV family protein with EDD domain
VAVVADSTAAMPRDLAREAQVRIVPLDVVVDGRRGLDGEDVADLVAALERGAKVVTSQPPPSALRAEYERAVADGASGVVSVHLSAALSGTADAARTAARDLPIPVVVVDTGLVGMGVGFAALAAAEAASAAGPRRFLRRSARAGVDDVALAARETAGSTVTWFLVDSLDHLRRGGRLSGAAAFLGTIFQLHPLLTLVDGKIQVVARIRTRKAARARLERLAVDAVAVRRSAWVAVHHVGRAEVAEQMADRLREAGASRVVVSEAGAVLAAHAGPGLLAVVVAGAPGEPAA